MRERLQMARFRWRPTLVAAAVLATWGGAGCGGAPRSNEDVGLLRAALERDDVDVVRSWLDDGLSPDFGARPVAYPARGPLCDSVLGHAAAAGSAASVALLLARGADPDASADACGNTPPACASTDETRALLTRHGAAPAERVDCKDPRRTLRVGMTLDEARDPMRQVGGQLILDTPDRLSARLVSEAGSFLVRFERPPGVHPPEEVARLTIDDLRALPAEPLEGFAALGAYRLTVVAQPD